ncbi:MAG: family NAD(P)-dependent oxidoreductase [Chitinophagaceae bacterium]|nr:family NAD(P)-dependent oxidoreductase [Chitinophagaceae bacterium]
MKTTNNTILITGGGSGIGFETAKRFSEQGNEVIIIGRNQSKLDKAAGQLKNVTAIAADISKEEEVQRLVLHLKKDFPQLNVLMNNAASASVHTLAVTGGAYAMAQEEIVTNYLSVIRLIDQLLPLLSLQPEAAIINVSSVVAFAPAQSIPTYSASKAALHSYTKSLRMALTGTSKVKVFELMPPLVDTEFSKEIGGHNGIAPGAVADELLSALKEDRFEIHVGQTADLYKLYLSSPEEALLAINGARA